MLLNCSQNTKITHDLVVVCFLEISYLRNDEHFLKLKPGATELCGQFGEQRHKIIDAGDAQHYGPHGRRAHSRQTCFFSSFSPFYHDFTASSFYCVVTLSI